MYVPKEFRNENIEELKDFIRHNNFGMLVTEVNNRPWISHIPFMLDKNGDELSAHIFRGNIQWKEIDLSIEILVVFQGPHGYISSSWYDHENVPTWNYIAVHVYGSLRIIEGEELVDSLRQLVDHHEKGIPHPVSVDQMSPKFFNSELRGIVGFKIAITDIQAAYKLSQNRDAYNHKNIIQELEKKGNPASFTLAQQMKKHKPK